jgi:hypothetical protein
MSKLRISNYFDELVNTIDLKAERLLLSNQKMTDAQSNKINLERSELISAIRSAEQLNYHHFDSLERQFLENKTESELNETLFQKFAFLLDSDEVQIGSHQTSLGYLVLTDRYLNDSQISLYKELISNFSNIKSQSGTKIALIDNKNNFFDLDQTSKVIKKHSIN